MKNCANCGAPCNTSFCGECGQSQKYHKETFWHMISHFAGHYFHYDSKFWITLKALCFSPGKLTMAYHQHQRTRYIAPISLYIFISIVFFLLFSKAFQVRTTFGDSTQEFAIHYEAGQSIKHVHKQAKVYQYLKIDGDSLRNVAQNVIDTKEYCDSVYKATPFSFTRSYIVYVAGNKFLLDYAYKNGILSMPELFNEIINKFLNILPKIFFILMPLFALLLYGSFFGKSRSYYFVDHGVMSLHIHSFMFISLMTFLLISFVYLPDLSYMALFFGFLLPGIYFLIACKKFYRRSWWYVLLLGSLTWIMYFLLVTVVSVATLFVVTIYL